MGCATAAKKPQATEQPKSAFERQVAPEELDRTIKVFSDAIKQNPNYAGAYYNRAVAYFYKKDYDKSWQDVEKAQSMGMEFRPEFIDALKKASCRTE